MADLVTIYHPGIPGEEAIERTRSAYRSIYYSKGWRSNDDLAYTPTLDVDASVYRNAAGSWGRNWALAKDAASSRIVTVDFWGDSITDGVGATDWATQGYVALTAAAMQARYGDGGSGYLPLNRSTKTGTWTNAMGPLGAQATATAAASATWTIRGTTAAIFHLNAGVTGSWRYQVDGGSFTTVTTPVGLGLDPATVFITGLSDASHTLRVEWVSGTVSICGVEARRAMGIIPRRFCISGRTATEFSSCPVGQRSISWTNASATITTGASDPGFTAQDIGLYLANLDFTTGLPTDARITAVASATSATISAAATAGSSGNKPVSLHLNPPSIEDKQRDAMSSRTANGFGQAGLGVGDIAVIALSVNDMAGSGSFPTTARLEDGISAILDAYADQNSQGDAVLIINPPGTHPDRTRAYPAMAGAIQAVAAGYGAAVVDMWALIRHSTTYAEATWDYFADTIHPSDTGHAMIAQALTDLLTV